MFISVANHFCGGEGGALRGGVVPGEHCPQEAFLLLCLGLPFLGMLLVDVCYV